MNDFSLHILDLVQNSLTAGADDIVVTLAENSPPGSVVLVIRDNGGGIGERAGEELLSPFYSTKEKRKLGLGLALVEQTARLCQGWVKIRSKPGKGTVLICKFTANHWDLPARGRLDRTILALVAINGHCRWRFNWFDGSIWRRLDCQPNDSCPYSVLKSRIIAIFGEGN